MAATCTDVRTGLASMAPSCAMEGLIAVGRFLATTTVTKWSKHATIDRHSTHHSVNNNSLFETPIPIITKYQFKIKKKTE